MGTEASGSGAPVLEAIVLGGGSARRFGGRKLLAPWGDGVLLHAALRAALAAPVRAVTLVTGADEGLVAAAGRALDPDLRIVHAADHAEGLAASLRTGIASLPPDVAGAFVFLGDMPRVPERVLQPMADALQQGAVAVVPTFRETPGNPVLISRRLFAEVAGLTGDTGARSLLKALGDAVARVEAPDDGVLFDVDAPSDLAVNPAATP